MGGFKNLCLLNRLYVKVLQASVLISGRVTKF